MRSPSSLLSTASWVTAAIVAAVTLLTAAATLPSFAGRKAYIVLSGSMEPSIPVGGAVVTERVDSATLRAGDAITFVVRSGQLVTHRVTQVVQDEQGLGFRTRGDANRADDPEVTRPVNVVGRVWYTVPLAGYVLYAASLAQLKLALVLLAAGLLGWSALRRVSDSEDEPLRERGSRALVPIGK